MSVLPFRCFLVTAIPGHHLPGPPADMQRSSTKWQVSLSSKSSWRESPAVCNWWAPSYKWRDMGKWPKINEQGYNFLRLQAPLPLKKSLITLTGWDEENDGNHATELAGGNIQDTPPTAGPSDIHHALRPCNLTQIQSSLPCLASSKLEWFLFLDGFFPTEKKKTDGYFCAFLCRKAQGLEVIIQSKNAGPRIQIYQLGP